MLNYFISIFLLINSICFATYYSQSGQDRFVYESYFKNSTSGIFVDIGAHNGITFSNSNFFEKELGWKGLCIEPIPEVFEELKRNRSCTSIRGCVTDKTGTGKFLLISGYNEMLSGLIDKYDPRHVQRILSEVAKHGGTCNIIDVNCYLLNDLLDMHGITHINYLSLDTEGGEFDIIQSIDFKRYQIDVITLEDNYSDERFIPFLAEKGFICIGRCCQELYFVNKDFRAN